MPAATNLTSQTFTQLARAVQQWLRARGVALPKGTYCHVIEATARGLGFDSKSALDVALSRNPIQSKNIPTLDEWAARLWLIRSGIDGPIPDGFLREPASSLFLFPSTNSSSNQATDMTNTSTTEIEQQATVAQTNTLATDIVARYGKRVWDTADVLRGVGAKASDWPAHMMPFFALMLLESRALRARQAALADFKDGFDPTDTSDVADLRGAYAREAKAGQQTWQEDLILHGQNLAHVVSGGPSGFAARLRAYLAGFDDRTRRILGVNPAQEAKAYLNIDGTIRFLDGKGGDHLYHYCQAWSEVDLVEYDSSAITTLEEHIKRRWADISADTAGEHYTPADLIELVAGIAVDHFQRHPLPGKFLRIYDPTCGGGNMLFGVENAIRKQDELGNLRNLAKERYSIETYGQEINDHLFALAKVESWFRQHADIREGNTLTEDQFSGQQFDLIVANPPYGTDWKQIRDEIERDETGRFPAECRPPVSDGQHLFLQHIQHHLADDGLALVFCSGSTLFSGDAGGGESNARSKYILTDDGVWGIIQLPKNEFFNTGINTYVWVFKKSKPASMQGKMFLLNAESLFTKLRKSLGSKNCEIGELDRRGIVKLIGAAENDATVSILLNEPGCALGLDHQAKTMDGALPKLIKKGEETANEAAILRLLSVEAVHYSKVSLDLTRTDDQGRFMADTLELNDVNLFSCTKEEYPQLLGQRLCTSGSSETEFIENMKAFRERLPEEAKPLFDVENKQKSVNTAIENSDWIQITGNSKTDAGTVLYRWNPQERILVDDQGTILGRAQVKVVVKLAKSKKIKGGDEMAVKITIGPDIEKDTETAPFKINPDERQAAIDAFLGRWVRDPYEITQVQTGCEINFNRLFPKTGERKSLAEINNMLADIDAQIAALHKEGA